MTAQAPGPAHASGSPELPDPADEPDSSPLDGSPDRAGEASRPWVSLFSVALWALLIAAAVVVGKRLTDDGVPILSEAPPLFARWLPHTGPGTPWAVATALAIVALAPWATRVLSWRALLAVGYAASLSWTFALAMVSGFSEGIAERLTRNAEYLLEVSDAPGLSELLSTYTDRILGGQADSWVSHVAGHPPGALQFYLALDRLGLSGGAWAGVVTILVGCTSVVAVAVAVRALADESLARRALPFSVLAPAVIWVGVSADAVFTAVTAWAVALLAIAFSEARRGRARRCAVWALGSGLLFGLGIYLSYGLVLMAPVALAAAVQQRRLRPLLIAAVGAGIVALAYTLLGFHWWEALSLVRERYLAGYGGRRPYYYWVWANLAALALMLGPAVAAGLGHALGRVVSRLTGPVVSPAAGPAPGPAPGPARGPAAGRDGTAGLLAPVGGAAVSVLLATLSGMSKAEVERIWLPFGAWLTTACALLPVRQMRFWLAAQGLTALAIEHLLEIRW